MRKQLALFAASIALSTPAVRATHYTVETYDFPGAASSAVTGVNAAGRVIGDFLLPNMTTTGMRGALGFTARNGTYTQVGDSTLCRPAGRCLVDLQFINAWGEFAGTFSADVDFPGVFFQTVNTARAFVEPPGFPNTDIIYLAGLNDLGELAGCYTGEFVPQTTSFIQIGGVFSDITLPLANVSRPCVLGLNNLGQLMGTAVMQSDFPTNVGFILTGNHVSLFDIPADWDYDGFSIQPARINDAGRVIGTYRDPQDNVHGFAVIGDGVQKVDFPGAISTRPVAINIRGDIVGTYDIATTNPVGVQTLPFLLRAGIYSTVTLPVPGVLSVAGIDNFGRLFGSYGTHGFVATPAAN